MVITLHRIDKINTNKELSPLPMLMIEVTSHAKKDLSGYDTLIGRNNGKVTVPHCNFTYSLHGCYPYMSSTRRLRPFNDFVATLLTKALRQY